MNSLTRDEPSLYFLTTISTKEGTCLSVNNVRALQATETHEVQAAKRIPLFVFAHQDLGIGEINVQSALVQVQ